MKYIREKNENSLINDFIKIFNKEILKKKKKKKD